MHEMKKLRSELGDVHSVLATIHNNLMTSASLGQYLITLLVYTHSLMLY